MFSEPEQKLSIILCILSICVGSGIKKLPRWLISESKKVFATQILPGRLKLKRFQNRTEFSSFLIVFEKLLLRSLNLLSISIPSRVKELEILNSHTSRLLIFSVLPTGITNDLSKLHLRPEKVENCTKTFLSHNKFDWLRRANAEVLSAKPSALSVSRSDSQTKRLFTAELFWSSRKGLDGFRKCWKTPFRLGSNSIRKRRICCPMLYWPGESISPCGLLDSRLKGADSSPSFRMMQAYLFFPTVSSMLVKLGPKPKNL